MAKATFYTVCAISLKVVIVAHATFYTVWYTSIIRRNLDWQQGSQTILSKVLQNYSRSSTLRVYVLRISRPRYASLTTLTLE